MATSMLRNADTDRADEDAQSSRILAPEFGQRLGDLLGLLDACKWASRYASEAELSDGRDHVLELAICAINHIGTECQRMIRRAGVEPHGHFDRSELGD